MLRMTLPVAVWLVLAAVLGNAAEGTTPGELRSYSTIQSIGIEWDIGGDTDHDATCKVRYRPQGSGAWKEALPLFRVDCFNEWGKGKADRAYNMLAGSILFLQPDTTYEVQLDLVDPDGGTANRTVIVRTRPLPTLPQTGRTWHVVPGSGSGDGSKDKPFRGLEAAQAAARPGDIVLLGPGQYGSFTFDKGGEPGRYLVWKRAAAGEAEFGKVTVSASHLWLEGLTFQGQGETGLRGQGAVTDVVVSRCQFTGFHYSIALNKQASNWYIADNVIVGDMDPAKNPKDWASGEGVELAFSSGHVVAHNRISHVADGISYCRSNCDIFGNDIFDTTDDGLEPDYGYANNRFWGNRLHNTGNYALSFQPQFAGPWYFLRNQVINPKGIFKFNYPMDGFLLVNNTFVSWGGIRRPPTDIFRSYSRNNLYISLGDQAPVWSGPGPDARVSGPHWRTNVDYDGFDWGKAPIGFIWSGTKYKDIADFARGLGIEQHAIRVHKDEIFEKCEFRETPGAAGPQLLTLRKGCNAIDAGAVVPNLSDDFVGQAPDLGAHEFGKPVAHYGPRPPAKGAGQ